MGGPRGWLEGVLIAALLMVAFAVKGLLIEPPSLPSKIGSGAFQTQRAIGRLQRILGDQRPHSVDTASDDAVRDRLVTEIRAMGLQPQVREASNCTKDPRTHIISCADIHNVVAIIPGRASGPFLLLNAHYDSTPTGPGASDDGLGVATLLEVASNLKGSHLERPVVLLFNEGEEFGLNGSAAFMRSDPLARRIDSLINIDSRGVTGPALMFETSDPNAPALSIYANGAQRPYANSLSTDFARLIPNTTDVVEFKRAGWTYLNFAIVGNETRYHSPGDTIAALDQRSLYHVGSEVLALTRIMAETPSAAVHAGQVVFTDIAGRAFIRLPLTLAAGLLGSLLILASILAWRERTFKKDLLLVSAATVAGIGSSGLVAMLAGLVRRGDFWRGYPLVTYLAVYSALLAVMTAIFSRWAVGADRGRLRSAAWLFILFLGAALSLFLPGATIFFLIAPAIAVVGLVLQRRLPKAATALMIVAAIVQFFMIAEMLALIEMLLIDGPLWSVTPLAALAALPFLIEVHDANLRPAAAGLLALSVILWTTALFLNRSSSERPSSFNIDYFRDADHNSASWAVGTKDAPLPIGFPDRWHSGTLPYNPRTRWIAKAPVLSTPSPGARVLASQAAGGGRRLTLALSTGGADALSIRFPRSAKLLGIGLPGALERPFSSKPTVLRCSGRSCEGLVIEALLADRAPIKAELFSYQFHLPPQGKELEKARPSKAIPQYAPDSTITMSSARL